MEHTPWTYHIGEDYFTIYNSKDEEVLTSPCSPDADAPLIESIVQAVNSHDKLVAALIGMIEHSSCRCGGFDGREIVPQPCDICKAAQTAITNVTK